MPALGISLNTSDFDYHLPAELIAQTPVEPRDHSRLLVLCRSSGAIEHRCFHKLPDLLAPGDLMVVNDSRVIPARLVGRRPTGGRVELLLVRRHSGLVWECLARPGRRLRPGTQVAFDGSGLHAEVVEHVPGGGVKVAFSEEPLLDRLGQVALPPYIHQPLANPERYQTVYASADGSLAAPTAGLHFTPGLLEALRTRGVGLATVTLHVGPATFLPVRAEDPRRHRVPPEHCELGEAACAAIDQARAAGKRVVAVGTTVVRTLEAAALRSAEGHLAPFSGWNDLVVLPGHEFNVVDALITNFHLPRSTNLMLVAAFAGWEHVRAAYAEAIARRYRFYSLGDAMLIL